MLVGFALFCCGCSRGVTPPKLDPQAAAQEALTEYDANKDGYLDAGELRRCPALYDSLKSMDTDGDGKLSAEEIAARLEKIRESKVALVGTSCSVILDGRPLAGATVTFVPEPFMGPSVKPAAGVSDEAGTVTLRVDGQSLPGCHCGFFRITVSKKDGDHETLPERYNTQTVLGQQVASDLRGGIKLRLDSGY